VFITWLFCVHSAAQQANLDVSRWHKTMAGKPTQVMVLGSSHLSQYAKGFDPASLTALLDKLAAFSPQIITIEALSGQ